MLNDTSKVQAVGRLTLCPLHEEDMMEAERNWLDGGILRAYDSSPTGLAVCLVIKCTGSCGRL